MKSHPYLRIYLYLTAAGRGRIRFLLLLFNHMTLGIWTTLPRNSQPTMDLTWGKGGEERRRENMKHEVVRVGKKGRIWLELGKEDECDQCTLHEILKELTKTLQK